ncbi:MAG: peptidylprolyl isomerase [Clostridia bacterium]|nr:peptidylprolyl isomerase [Clostridia bacterium]
MKYIFGTKNKGKIEHLKQIFKELPFELVIKDDLKDASETNHHIQENALEKAKFYYEQYHEPVFSIDSGLYFDEVTDKEQPGAHVRRVNDISLSDEEMILYYSQLADKYGGKLTARYRNAIALVINENEHYTYDGNDIASEPFQIITQPHEIRKEGFPLDSLSVDITTGSYYYDLKNESAEFTEMNEGFRNFFLKHYKHPLVTLKFKGYAPIKIELYPEYAKDTVKNFIELIQKGYYNDKALCRIVPGRLIQSGDPSLKPENWTDDTPGYILNGEFDREGYRNPLDFIKGTIGMAMAGSEWTPYATAGSFFIMNKDETTLNGIVPAFGRVVENLQVIDALNQVETHQRYGYDAPEEVIFIESITVDTFNYVYGSPKKIYFSILEP